MGATRPAVGGAAELLRLQRLAGNRSVACRLHPHGSEPGAHRRPDARPGVPVVPVQRCFKCLARLLCCCGGSREYAIDETEPLFEDDGLPRYEDQIYTGILSSVRVGDSFTPTAAWQTQPTLLNGRYTVHQRVEGREILVAATLATTQGGEVVVGTSQASFRTDGDVVYFTSFESHPPLSGLGSVVLGFLRARGTKLVPDGPTAGALTFYARYGMLEKTLHPNEATMRRVEDYLASTKSEREELKRLLELPASRRRLDEIQAKVRVIELRGAMGLIK